MSEEPTDVPIQQAPVAQVSQVEVNEAVRVLRGEKKAFTLQVFLKSGRQFEVQTDSSIEFVFIEEERSNWICLTGIPKAYDKFPVARACDVEFMHLEKNV